MNTDRFIVEGEAAYIDTNKGRFIIDAEDVELLERGALKIKTKSNTHYASIVIGQHTDHAQYCYAHRIIMKAPKGLEVDHINHNGLDNRKINLRICTRQENRRNSLPPRNQYKGVIYVAKNKTKKWRAISKVDGKRVSLGYYSTPEEAGHAYNQFAQQEFGEFAYLNNIPT